MDDEFSQQDCAFRDMVRNFIAEHYPADLRKMTDNRDGMSKEDYLAWHRILASKGWVAPAWPAELGGAGWTPTQRHIWSEEQTRAETMPILSFGIDMVAPIIYTFGSDAQMQRFLPGTYNGDIWWCQGYAEPESGSDLTDLQTSALRLGDYYLVNGRKTWTSFAQYADWGFFLVRTATGIEPRAGITFLLIDMTTPGVSVRPIVTLDSEHELNDVFLDNVKVPVENRIFDENRGWTAVEFLLAQTNYGVAGVAGCRRGIDRIRKMAAHKVGDRSGSLLQDPFFRRKIVELEIELTALEYTELRALAGEAADTGLTSSLLKLRGTEIKQHVYELALEAAGHYGAPDNGGLRAAGGNAYPIGPDYAHGTGHDYFASRKTSLSGTTDEVRRNMIAETLLRL